MDEHNPGTWTLEAYIVHNEAMRKLQAELDDERDRRYAEVTAEREKALKIKETADRTALELDREIRAYKDEQANNLRRQIDSERGLYVTHAEMVAHAEKTDAVVTPILEYIASTRGQNQGAGSTVTWIFAGTGWIGVIVMIIVALT
jgi:Skp family chaperone for outer membrane proteins